MVTFFKVTILKPYKKIYLRFYLWVYSIFIFL